MRKEFKPLQFVPRSSRTPVIPVEWTTVMTLHSPAYHIVVPTQVLLLPAAKRPVQMDQSRAWRTATQFFGFDREETATSQYTRPRYVVEVMEDCGDDGHTWFDCIGWALVTEAMLMEFIDAAESAASLYEYPRFITESE